MNINTDFATQQLTVTTTAQALTVPTGAKYALISVESDISTRACRIWENGSNPTAAIGLIKANLDTFDITGANNLANFRIILDTLAAASTLTKLNILYYK